MIELTNRRVVAIDGGTGTGKSRLGYELAQLLRTKGVPALFISTGYLYRAVTFAVLEAALAQAQRRRVRQGERLDWAIDRVRQLGEADMVAAIDNHSIAMHGGQVWLDEAPVDAETQLKTPGIGIVIPHVAGFPEVRAMV
jgi:cytidylate kinase